MLSPYPWQDRQWRQLLSSLEQGRLPHALLLAGAEGLGVGHFARALAARLLCTGGTAEEACGACKSCLLFAAGNHPDLVVIEPEEAGKVIKVEAVRELVEFIHLSSQYGRHKVAIIEPAEAMNRSTANSLLKTLEEPTPASVLILCSRQPAQLPVTIRSRCQRLNFTGRDDENTRTWLTEQLTDGERARELLALAGGRPLAALQLEQEASLEKQAALLDGLIAVAGGARDPVSTARDWAGLGAPLVLQWLLEFIRIMIRAGLSRRPVPVDNPLQPRLEQLGRGRDPIQLLDLYAKVLRNYRAATGPFNLNPQGLLEEIIVNWQALAQPTEEETQ